jgi:hypothetical protein
MIFPAHSPYAMMDNLQRRFDIKYLRKKVFAESVASVGQPRFVLRFAPEE